MPTMLASTLRIPAGLSAKDAAFYQEHGWVTTSTVIEDSLIYDALTGLQQHWAGHRDRKLDGAGKQFADWMPGDGAGTRNNEYLSLQNRKVRNLAWSPIVGSIAARAAGTPEIRLFDDQIVFKPGGQTEAVVGWHVDGDYWGTCTSRNMLTAWLPLHDCPEEMGPLVVLDGSHKWSSLQRGQFSLHHCRTIHGSYPNRSNRPRIALAVHMQDRDNQYQAAKKPDGRPVQLYNDLICGKNSNGNPDYRDKSVFPVLWNARLAAMCEERASC